MYFVRRITASRRLIKRERSIYSKASFPPPLYCMWQKRCRCAAICIIVSKAYSIRGACCEKLFIRCTKVKGNTTYIRRMRKGRLLHVVFICFSYQRWTENFMVCVFTLNTYVRMENLFRRDCYKQVTTIFRCFPPLECQ